VERDGPSALETTLPFDERQVLEENRPFLSKALEVRHISYSYFYFVLLLFRLFSFFEMIVPFVFSW